jgi:hypothetical protein
MPSPWTCVAGTQLGAVRPIGARGALLRSTALVGRLDACEAEQRVHLAQPLEEQHTRDVLLEALGHVRLLAHEVRVVGRRRRRREHVPLGPLQVEVFIAHRAAAVGLDGLPHLVAREGVDAGQLRRLLQRLHDGRGFDGALDVFEERPAVSDELRERAARLRDGKHRERHREPAVRRAEQDGARNFGAAILEAC